MTTTNLPTASECVGRDMRTIYSARANTQDLIGLYRDRVVQARQQSEQSERTIFPDPVVAEGGIARVVCEGYDLTSGIDALYSAYIKRNAECELVGIFQALEVIIVADRDGSEACVPLRPFIHMIETQNEVDYIDLRFTPGKVDLYDSHTVVTYDVEAV